MVSPPLPGRHRAARAAALAALLAACAHPSPPPAPASPPLPPPGAPPAAGRYGPEPRIDPSPAETRAIEVARDRLGRGAERPRLSGALVLAARALAQRAAAGASDPLSRAALRDALAGGGSFDPSPAAFVARAAADRIPEALEQVLGAATATHVGAGVVPVEGGAVAVVLAANRKLRLDPFPREAPAGGSAVLSGDLLHGLRAPRVYATLPGDEVQEIDVAGSGPFRALLRFGAPGRYLVEVTGEGAGGPEVAALLAVAVGGAPADAPAAAPAAGPEPEDPAAAERQVVQALDALRARHGLGPLMAAPELAELARRHSAAMRAAGRVAHVVPGSGEMGDRLARARIPFLRAYENVARATTALAAHETAVESPAHLRNMLQPGATRVGVGIARDRLPSGDRWVYLTEVFLEPLDTGADSALTPDARIREALWKERARLKLPPLTVDPALDAVARDGAAALRDSDARDPADLAARALALPRRLTAADAFVASAPADAIRSANLPDARFRRVGVGVVEGASRRFGAGRLFIAVVYSD